MTEHTGGASVANKYKPLLLCKFCTVEENDFDRNPYLYLLLKSLSKGFTCVTIMV